MAVRTGQVKSGGQGKRRMFPMTSMWTNQDVHDFVCDIGYGKYAKCFKNSALNGQRLLGITPYDLQRIGVSSLQDAVHLCASLVTSTNRVWHDPDNPNTPPNRSYSSSTKGRIVPDPRLPPGLQPEKSATFDPRLPALPGQPYGIEWRDMGLPMRQGAYTERVFVFNPRPSPFHGHGITLVQKPAAF